ncbi:MAG: universal stress protein [Gammaproteobacteria bacterium]
MNLVGFPMTFNRILVLVDTRALFARAQTSRSLDRITRLAMEHGASLTLCDVVESPPADAAGSALAERLHQLRLDFARDGLERVAEPIRDLLPVSIEVWTGTPFLVVTQKVLRDRYDLVVHVTASAEPQEGLGPDDMHLARKCPCPVWVMDTRRDRSYRHIAVAVDRDIFANTRHASTFALQLSQTALMIGRLENARVTIVHAWQPFAADLLEDPRVALSDAEVEHYVGEQELNHARWLDALEQAVKEAGGGSSGAVPIGSVLLSGSPVEAVVDYVERHDADLLVMGTVGVTTVPGLFIGNTAESILTRVRAPVLALKPPGFHSPIRAVDEETDFETAITALNTEHST